MTGTQHLAGTFILNLLYSEGRTNRGGRSKRGSTARYMTQFSSKLTDKSLNEWSICLSVLTILNAKSKLDLALIRVLLEAFFAGQSLLHLKATAAFYSIVLTAVHSQKPFLKPFNWKRERNSFSGSTA